VAWTFQAVEKALPWPFFAGFFVRPFFRLSCYANSCWTGCGCYLCEVTFAYVPRCLGYLQCEFYEGYYDINYPVTSDLIMTWYCIYEERNKTSFMGMKLVQLISNVLKTVWNYHCEWFYFKAHFLLVIWPINFVIHKCSD
jgi:hypothetical protein